MPTELVVVGGEMAVACVCCFKVTAFSFDRHGNRIWRQAAALLESEHARYAVGEVAVPYGRCSEPSNVAAGGGACPVRFRCAGCDTSAPTSPTSRT